MDAKVKIEQENDTLTVSVVGEINGECNLPDFKILQIRKIVLELTGINYINSGGVRRWILWMAQAKATYPNATFNFENFPSLFVKQVANVQGFLPPGSSVTSFMVPFYCEKCGTNTERAFKRGVDFKPSASRQEMLAKITTLKCPKCGSEMEIDAVPEYYLEL
jgi:Zn finger protein HypA/HybF involved in hydrogenase expression